MLKVYCSFVAALAALFIGWGAISRPALLVATPSSLPTLSVSPDPCWHPGIERNIGIAEMPCPMKSER
jgi:hypothetical protein